MKITRWFGLFSLALLTFSGCDKPGITTAPVAVPASVQPAGKAQPKLPTIRLYLGAREMPAELAITPEQKAAGMMFRQEMGEMEGMLFIFGEPHRASFWMRNTLLPLSAAYIDNEGVILEIRDMKPLDETPVVAATDQVRYVLETRQGWFERNKVPVGSVVRTERGSLQETFFRAR